MLPKDERSSSRVTSLARRRVLTFASLLLVIEFADEVVFGAREAAWPIVRADLGLSYGQIGLLLGVPSVIASVVEPIIGILGDGWRRRALIVGGGLGFTASLLLSAVAPSFPLLLISFILFYPSSGAFVSLSQASLMDSNPARHEQLMARWTAAGSMGVLAGPLLLAGATTIGLGWRGLYAALGALSLLLTLLVWRRPFPPPSEEASEQTLRQGLGEALAALRRWQVLRWLVLLEFSNFMLDLLLGFLALYFVDEVGTTITMAGGAVAVWVGVGLLGDLLLIPLLERIRGLSYLRYSAGLMLILYPTFLLLPTIEGKLVLLGLMGLANAGWYAILQAQLYSALPGRSGTVTAISALFGIGAGLVPLLLGLLAEAMGLGVMMWVLLLGPIVLLLALPRGIVEGAKQGEGT